MSLLTICCAHLGLYAILMNNDAFFRFGSYTLHLNGARVSDSGVYSCQINTVPIKELNVKLIVEPGRFSLIRRNIE